MKIDSPTFLTETTFISSSVQFSSGSQKFGNTDDDTHIFIGDISGSSRTTGSFGHLNIAGTGNNAANFQVGNRTLSLKLSSTFLLQITGRPKDIYVKTFP